MDIMQKLVRDDLRTLTRTPARTGIDCGKWDSLQPSSSLPDMFTAKVGQTDVKFAIAATACCIFRLAMSHEHQSHRDAWRHGRLFQVRRFHTLLHRVRPTPTNTTTPPHTSIFPHKRSPIHPTRSVIAAPSPTSCRRAYGRKRPSGTLAHRPSAGAIIRYRPAAPRSMSELSVVTLMSTSNISATVP